MTILQRHVLHQFVPPLFFAIVVLAGVLLMDRLFLLADLLVRKGVAVAVVAEIAALSLPFVVSICAPLGSLISGVMTFGRMAQDNEIRATRAAGVPVWRVVVPAFWFCGVMLLVMLFFNGFVVPESQHRVRNLLTDVARKKPALRIRERVFMDDFPGYMAYIGAIDERRSSVKGVIIFDRSSAGARPSFVTAPHGLISYTPDGRYLSLRLFDGEMHELIGERGYRRLQFAEHTINVPADDELVRHDREYRSNQEMAMPHLLRELREQIRIRNRLLIELNTADTAQADPAAREVRLREANARLRHTRLEITRYQTELQKRASLAFSCLLFVLFGAPLGVLLRRGGLGTGFVVGLVFFGIFYVLLLAGQTLVDSGRISPFVGMWLPNLVLVLPTAELMAHALFERSVLTAVGERFR